MARTKKPKKVKKLKIDKKLSLAELWNTFNFGITEELLDPFGKYEKKSKEETRVKLLAFMEEHNLSEGDCVDEKEYKENNRIVIIPSEKYYKEKLKKEKQKKKHIKQVKRKDKGVTVLETDIGCGLTLREFRNIMYPQTERSGYMAVCTIEDGKLTQRMTKPRDMHRYVDRKKDCYLSTNTFYTYKRRNKFIRQINSLYIDIDYYTLKITLKQVLQTIKDLVEEDKIPMPTFIINSGRGVQVYWKLHGDKGVTEKAKRLHGYIEEYLYETLKHVGADPKATDLARILRVPGTTNTKSGKKVTVLEYNEEAIYSMMDFIRYDGVGYKEAERKYKEIAKKIETREERKAKFQVIDGNGNSKKPKEKKKKVFSPFTLHANRAKDIETLIKLRNGHMPKMRQTAMHLYYYWQLHNFQGDSKKAFEKVEALNQKLFKPLEATELLESLETTKRTVVSHYSSFGNIRFLGEKPNDVVLYNYSTEKLISLLSISQTEQQFLLTILNREEKNRRRRIRERAKRRNENGLTQREQAKLDTTMLIQKLKAEGFSQSQVAEKIGKSIPTVKRHWNVEVEIQTEVMKQAN